MARIEYAVNRVGAKRVVLDAIGAVFPQFSDSSLVRRELHRVATGLRRLGVTSMLTVNRRRIGTPYWSGPKKDPLFL